MSSEVLKSPETYLKFEETFGEEVRKSLQIGSPPDLRKQCCGYINNVRQTESPSPGTPLVLIAVTTPNPQEKDFHVALSPWKDIHLYPTIENVLFLFLFFSFRVTEA